LLDGQGIQKATVDKFSRYKSFGGSFIPVFEVLFSPGLLMVLKFWYDDIMDPVMLTG